MSHPGRLPVLNLGHDSLEVFPAVLCCTHLAFATLWQPKDMVNCTHCSSACAQRDSIVGPGRVLRMLCKRSCCGL